MFVYCRLVVLFIAGIFLPAFPAWSIEQIQLQLGDLRGDGWSARDVTVLYNIGENSRGQFTVTATESTLPAPVGRIQSSRITCEDLQLDADTIDCMKGTLRGSNDFLGPVEGRLEFHYRMSNSATRFTMSGLKLRGNVVSLQGNVNFPRWDVALTGKGLRLESLLELAAALGIDTGYEASGALDLELQMRGSADKVDQIKTVSAFSETKISNAAGTQAGEGLGFLMTAKLVPTADAWNIETTLQGTRGQVYFDPIFMEIKDQPVELALLASWTPASEKLQIASLQWRQPGVLRAQGQIGLRLKPEPVVTDLDIQIEDAELASVYSTFVKPWFLGAMGGDLDAKGRVRGRVRARDGSLQSIQLTLDSVSVTDQLGRIQVDGLQGDLDWATDEQQRRSTLSWERAGLFKMEIGAASIPVVSQGLTATLAQPVRIPVLDGELQIEHWNVERPGSPEMRWQFDGLLTPISLKAFTTAMDWPALSGKLSGLIPQVSYDAGLLKVDGVLLVRAFDGNITVRDLELEQPFGIVPRLRADIAIDNLDLNTLTRSFSFGKIEGRLGGYVKGLRMEQWRPAAFDAKFESLPNDNSRRRISQRALDNISSIGGGGVGNALSRSFLRFFKDFAYRHLGISCRLQNGVCQMGGVLPAKAGGYYIVQGSVIPPRVDVIGYADRVDWKTLVKQLEDATSGEAPPTVQ